MTREALLKLNAQQAAGTAQHETTMLCSKDRLSNAGSVLRHGAGMTVLEAHRLTSWYVGSWYAHFSKAGE